MDFSWSEEQDAVYHKFLHFAQKEIRKDENKDQFWTRTQWHACGEAGLLGLCVPESYGGCGFGALTTARAIEAFGCGCEDIGLVFSAAAHLFACCMPIVECGSNELKERLLPGLCSGELVGANAITEKDAGSDVFAVKTRAVRDGDFYILNGVKSYVSNGPVTDVFVTYAMTNPTHGYLGITGFVVEKGTPGLVIGDAFQKMGLTSTPACQISFNECRVPGTHILKKEGQGSLVFKRSMQWERACLFALYIGLMERQLKQSITYARERHQFGKAIGKNQAIGHTLANMKLRLEAARLLLYRACWQFERGENALLNIALSKLAISEAAIQSGLEAIHIHGSAGFGSEYGIESMLRDAIPSTIFSGTSEMQRDIIANELGL